MEHLPWYVATLFLFMLLIAVLLFGKAALPAKLPIAVVLLVIVVQSVLGSAGFYSHAGALTTRFPLLVMPLSAYFILLFFTRSGRAMIDSLDIRMLTLLHTVRVGVEVVLFWLFVHRAVPVAMIFEGRNFDVVSGLTAPFMYYFGFIKKRLSLQVILIWNIACVLLLLNVVTSAVLSLPDRFSRFGFEQPNIGVGYFPFLLLPSVLVPLVLFAHAVAIRQLVLHKPLAGETGKIGETGIETS